MITRDVEASAVADLALSPPRAALAATGDDEILVLPVSVTLEEPADPATSPRIVRVPEGGPDLADRNVVVIADDGPQWFRLRSLTVRGTAKAVGHCTYRVVPKRIVAWDYGSLHGVPTPPGSSTPQPTSFSVGDEKDAHPLRSPNLAGAIRSSRVMILASRSRRARPSRYRCGSSPTAAASIRRPRRRPGRCAMWLLRRRWPCCSAARAGTTRVGFSCADTHERSAARRHRRCSPG